MANMFASRKGPLLIAGGLLGGLLYMTYGAPQQPRPRAAHEAGQQASVSERLEAAAGTGGARARDDEGRAALAQNDPKDTHLYSASPSAYSKRNPDRKRGDLGGDETTVGGGGQGKHIGERDPEKAGDMPWKRIGAGK